MAKIDLKKTQLPVVETRSWEQEERDLLGPDVKQSFVLGTLDTPAGTVPVIGPELSKKDLFGSLKVRLGIGRMSYTVDPGLYALGNPDQDSPVLVTANYKLSFDHLRKELSGRNLWILVLDTYGINVWCSAGKGTFGTRELVRRIELTRLGEIVNHRNLILPQLSAPGVSAHAVKKMSGFKVIYGPILSRDLPEFLDNGLKATPPMRLKSFSLMERAVLIPVELTGAVKPASIAIAIYFLLGGIGPGVSFWQNALAHGLFADVIILCGIGAGAILTPLLLPWLPGRAFSLKGLWPGVFVGFTILLYESKGPYSTAGALEFCGYLLLISAVSSYVGMNFTGASTYTSLSGVKKEMKYALPLQIAGATVGTALWISSRFL